MIDSEGCLFRTQLTHDQSKGRIVKFWFNNCDYNLEKKRLLMRNMGVLKLRNKRIVVYKQIFSYQ